MDADRDAAGTAAQDNDTHHPVGHRVTADRTPTGPAPTRPDTVLTLRGATLADGRTADVRIVGHRIADVTPPGVLARTGDEESLTGHLLLPAPVEPHAHLDKALTADLLLDGTGDPAGTDDLAGAVAVWLRHRPTLAHRDIVRRATATARTYLAHGATAVRTHVDVGTDLGLRALTAVLEVREALRAELDLQVVAFIGVPLTGVAGAGHRALLREAVAAGADVVGGCPYLDPDPVAYHEQCLAVAADHRCPVDLHTDETLDPGVLTVRDFARIVTRTGFRHGATASHCVSLGAAPPPVAADVAAQIAAAGLGVVCLPQTNLYLQARDRHRAPPRGLTALRALRHAGVTVAAGGDNVQDPFNSLGRADPLETAALLVLAGHQRPADAYAAVSDHARAVMGLPAVTIEPGAPAELLAVRADSVRHALATAPAERLVVHRGRIVARTAVHRQYPQYPQHPATGRTT